MALSPSEEAHLRGAIALSVRAVENGNMPFGALFVDSNGQVIAEAENTGITKRNTLNHAETNLMNDLVTRFSQDVIAAGTFFTSCEPCAMCSGAMYWGGVNRVVFGLSEAQLQRITGANPLNATMSGVGAHTVLNSGAREVEVSGPHLVEEASVVHLDYWAAH